MKGTSASLASWPLWFQSPRWFESQSAQLRNLADSVCVRVLYGVPYTYLYSPGESSAATVVRVVQTIEDYPLAPALWRSPCAVTDVPHGRGIHLAQCRIHEEIETASYWGGNNMPDSVQGQFDGSTLRVSNL